MHGTDAKLVNPSPDAPNRDPRTAAQRLQDDATTRNASVSIDRAFKSENMLGDHKGKLALGVAATLGLMVFYKWREKRLAKEDPDEHARLQRMKAAVRAGESKAKQEH